MQKIVNFTVRQFRLLLSHWSLWFRHDNHDVELKNLVNFLSPKKTKYDLLRIGGEKDGGYLLPNDLIGISRCLSPGSNKVWNFERDLLFSHGIPSVIMDRGNNLPENVDSRIQTIDSWVSSDDLPGYTSLNTWISTGLSFGTQDLMLQMDIEGAEYDAIFATSDSNLRRFRILVIEFHYTNKFTNSELFKEYFYKVFEKLERNFTVLHFHPNNCCGTWTYRNITLPNVFELTLLRNDRIDEVLGTSQLPHPLDQDCIPQNKPIVIKF